MDFEVKDRSAGWTQLVVRFAGQFIEYGLDGDDEKLVAEAVTSSIPAPQEVRAIQDSFQD